MKPVYKVVPFTAVINFKKGEKTVSEQLQSLIDVYVADGWEYLQLESVPTVYNDSGCFGIGAKSTQSFNHMLIFKRLT
ncbi:DUF4177 domain-containing protein [Telluribacter sp. SYSU D00476]|uniref:DUF4177 domain-containing protein n=1 Tax=Telluribacter sp. SYSU D00476 TaxID=2811430 RepID=UPI001FF2D697|nr:DUF4177 domain-containing protein [Telluribacter sp. SYSU D00476]